MLSAAADKTAADAGNLPGNQVIAWNRPGLATTRRCPFRTPGETGDPGRPRVRQIAGSLSHATRDPAGNARRPGRQAAGLAGSNPSSASTPPLHPGAGPRRRLHLSALDISRCQACWSLLGIDPARINPVTDILTDQAGSPVPRPPSPRPGMPPTCSRFTLPVRVHIPPRSSRRAPWPASTWTRIPSGWLIESTPDLCPPRSSPRHRTRRRQWQGSPLSQGILRLLSARSARRAAAAGALIALGVLAIGGRARSVPRRRGRGTHGLTAIGGDFRDAPASLPPRPQGRSPSWARLLGSAPPPTSRWPRDNRQAGGGLSGPGRPSSSARDHDQP